MGEPSHSRSSFSSSPSTTDSRNGDSLNTFDTSSPAAPSITNPPQGSSESELERPSLEKIAQQHIHKEKQLQCDVHIHSDGRFMSSLRAIHASDQGEVAASKRRTGATTNIITDNGLDNTTERPSPENKSPSPVKKPRRKLQRSRAFWIDRSPSPSGRVCEIEADDGLGEDELCALFEKINRGP